MPTPFHENSADLYYQYAGRPTVPVAEWKGMPQPGWRGASTRALGDLPPTYNVSAGPRSLLHSGPEQSPMSDGAPGLGALAEGERNALMLVGISAAIWWFFLRK